MKENSPSPNKVSVRAVKSLIEIRKHPGWYHPITNRQYFDSAFKYSPTIVDELNHIYNTSKFVERNFQYGVRLDAKEMVGWNAGIILNKPWYIISWIDTSGNQFIGCFISTKLIEQSKWTDVDFIFEDNGIYHKNDDFNPIPKDGQNKNWNVSFGLINEGQNGEFFELVLKIKEANESEMNCNVALAPMSALAKINDLCRNKPFKLLNYQQIHISNDYLKTAIEDLSDIRSFPLKYSPVTDNQWLDLDVSIDEINEQFKHLLPLLDYKHVTIEGYNLDQLNEGVKNAENAKDENAIQLIKKLRAICYEKVNDNEINPKSEIKKILGWNVGRLQGMPSLPWFSICYQDTYDRIMMCVWMSADVFNNKTTLDNIDSILQGANHVYEKQNNFVNIYPYQDRNKFTFSAKRIVEDSGNSFCVVQVLLQQSIKSPLVCYATFCPIESLNHVNNDIQFAPQKKYNKITTFIELNNDTLKEIDFERVCLVYYDEETHEFSIIVKPENQKNNLAMRSKNIFINQTDFIEYKGVYGTQHLLPDNLLRHLRLLLDNDDIRKLYNTEQEVFAFDKLSGDTKLEENWVVINFQPRHLMIAPWFREEYLSHLDDAIRFRLSGKTYFSNYDSDLMVCWTNIIKNYVGEKPETHRTNNPSDILFDDIIAYCESEDNHIDIAIKDSADNYKIKIFRTTIKSTNDFKTFLDFNLNNEKGIEDKHRGWTTYRDGSGRFLNIRAEYLDDIFTAMRIRNEIVHLKMTQISKNDRNELCYMIIECKDDFFTYD